MEQNVFTHFLRRRVELVGGLGSSVACAGDWVQVGLALGGCRGGRGRRVLRCAARRHVAVVEVIVYGFLERHDWRTVPPRLRSFKHVLEGQHWGGESGVITVCGVGPGRRVGAFRRERHGGARGLLRGVAEHRPGVLRGVPEHRHPVLRATHDLLRLREKETRYTSRWSTCMKPNKHAWATKFTQLSWISKYFSRNTSHRGRDMTLQWKNTKTSESPVPIF